MVQSKVIHMLFQSTFPRGERRSLLRDPLDSMHFNPRSHVGNDYVVSDSSVPDTSISIHVPTWGTTKGFFFVLKFIGISIHVPTWGTTHVNIPFSIDEIISIHVPTWGTTTATVVDYGLPEISIHVPTWGTTKWPVFLL